MIHGRPWNTSLRVSKNIAVNQMLECPHRGANCELDFDSFIGLSAKNHTHVTCSDQPNIDPVTHTDIAVNPAAVEVSDKPTRDCDDDFVDVNTDWCRMYDLCDVDKNVVVLYCGLYVS